MPHHSVWTALFAVSIAAAIGQPVVAQTHHGAGISGQHVGTDVDANYIREHSGPPDSVRLTAAVLWRGSPNWTGGAVATPALRARMDSIRQDSQRRGVVAGGILTSTAAAWVEYDERARTVFLLQNAYGVSRSRDSTTVIMVDRVDHVGGEPIVILATVACSKTPEADLRSLSDQSIILAMRTNHAHWRDCLLADTRIADFVNRRTSR
jgi:hypothetical protein